MQALRFREDGVVDEHFGLRLIASVDIAAIFVEAVEGEGVAVGDDFHEVVAVGYVRWHRRGERGSHERSVHVHGPEIIDLAIVGEESVGGIVISRAMQRVGATSGVRREEAVPFENREHGADVGVAGECERSAGRSAAILREIDRTQARASAGVGDVGGRRISSGNGRICAVAAEVVPCGDASAIGKAEIRGVEMPCGPRDWRSRGTHNAQCAAADVRCPTVSECSAECGRARSRVGEPASAIDGNGNRESRNRAKPQRSIVGDWARSELACGTADFQRAVADRRPSAIGVRPGECEFAAPDFRQCSGVGDDSGKGRIVCIAHGECRAAERHAGRRVRRGK